MMESPSARSAPIRQDRERTFFAVETLIEVAGVMIPMSCSPLAKLTAVMRSERATPL